MRTREAAERFEALGAQAVVGDITQAADRKRALDGVALVVNTATTFRDPEVAESGMYAPDTCGAYQNTACTGSS